MTFKIPQSLAFAASLALLAAPAAAEIKFENSSGGATTLYGHFDPAYLSFDDGTVTTGTVVDNAASNSRVGLWYRQPMGENKFSFNLETALGFRASSGVSQNFTPDGLDWDRTKIRKVDLALATQSFGTFSLGQGSMASDGIAILDLSGTALANYVAIGDTAGSFLFRDTAGVLSGNTVSTAFADFDGSRRMRIRYDSPSFSGFVISTSYGQEVLAKNNDDDFYDITLRYSKDFGDIKLDVGVGYDVRDPVAGANVYSTIGSLTMLHVSGFSFTLAAGDRSSAGNYVYAKIGYQADWFAVGTTALAVDFYGGSDQVSAGSDSESIGFGAVQYFDNANIEAYMGYRAYELDEIAANYQDASSFIIGARWRF